MIKTFTTHLDNLDAISKEILGHINAKTILFYGEMGAGKTTLINALLKALRSNDNASSPTFSIVNEYQLPSEKVFHFDFYRIESIEDAYNFGIEDYLNSPHWLFMEWPQLIEPLIAQKTNSISIEITSETERQITLKVI